MSGLLDFLHNPFEHWNMGAETILVLIVLTVFLWWATTPRGD